jgi:hypothetical protein
MRRDLVEAVGALQRHELDLAFGNVAGLGRPLPPDLTAEPVMTDTIAALVSVRSDLAARADVTTADLVRRGIWWPMAGRAGPPTGAYPARSASPATPARSAQCAQQKIRPPPSTPWPMMRQPQCSQVGAIAWIAHSKESKVPVRPSRVISKALS